MADPVPGEPFYFAKGVCRDGVTQWRAGFLTLTDGTIDQILVNNECNRIFLNLHFRANGITKHLGVPKNTKLILSREDIEQAFNGPVRWDDLGVRYGVTS